LLYFVQLGLFMDIAYRDSIPFVVVVSMRP
jgi:hypothetical protein